MRRFIFAYVCVFTALHSFADEVDNYVKRQMWRYHIPGVSLAVIKDGKVIKEKSYGLANVELNLPPTKDTIFQIGSVTKVFTATAVMILVNDGKVGLDDRITNYLANLPSTWSNITVRHLLSHRSGITNDYLDRESLAYRVPLSATQMIQSVADSPLAFEPGEKVAYSNTGYYLLGMLIEKVSGESYAKFMKDRIFVPLNMSSTSVNDLSAVVTNRASGYSYGTELRNNEYWDTSWLFSAGAIISSVADLIRWDAGLNTQKLLPQARIEEMWANGGGYYPLGWGLAVSDRYGRKLGNYGRTPGFSAGFQRWIDQRLTIVFLANMDGFTAGTAWNWDICDGISYLYLPDLIKPKKDDAPELTRAHRQLVLAAVAGTLAPEQFTEESRKQFFPGGAALLRAELTDLGVMKSFYPLDDTTTENLSPHRVRRYRGVFAKEKLCVDVEFDDERIHDLRIMFK
jgi:D-alanyl-D-alanine carboxypeptidase